MTSRRDFLKKSSLIALAPTVPWFLAQTARAATPERDGRMLVVIQLDGGNDGVNTVVPFTDEGYAKHRTTLRLPAHRLLKVSKEVGLHPAMADAAKLLENGRLAVVQGVGYPNPSQSHFKSMAIWHTGNVDLSRGGVEDAETRAALGWLGRGLDAGKKPADGAPGAAFVGSGAVPVALRGRRSVAAAVTRLEDSILARPPEAKPEAAGDSGEDLAAFVRQRTLDAYATSERMAEILNAKDGGAAYPATALAGRLQLVARLIKSGTGTRVYYTAQPGYDTHASQLPAHAELLAEFAGALKAFLDDLAAAKLADRVAVLCFSAFFHRSIACWIGFK